ncbi:hypothetical protein F6Y24_18440 [Xanthomonas arboricola pv. pruni]|nr:hypothetical protein F6Y24_18440 [Xanthomonas arboricola pv. pruni]RST74648.1 hypothetical protein EJL05_18775 [Xanthomonas arboricola pv. pruni]
MRAVRSVVRPKIFPSQAAKQVFKKAADQLPGAVSLPVAGPLAAWMPPRSLHGRIHGLSRKR